MAGRSKASVGGKWAAGARVSEVDVLEREAKDMEMQLKALQSRMQQQQLEDEAVVKTGGCRWKSARPDKGTVLSYAKDVQEKYRNKYGTGDDPAQWAPSAADTVGKPRNPQKPAAGAGVAAASPAATFYHKDVDAWAIADVGEWLRSVRLDGYVPSFAVNEISGPVLLEIGLDDLDYMGVTVLAHRKLILKGIEDLRKNKRVTIQQQAAVVELAPPAAKLDSVSSVKAKAPAAATGEVVHWSHLEPLSSHEVSSSSARFTANAADEEPDFLDEAAERAAFQAALSSWRNEGGGPVKIVREGETETDVSKMGANDDGMWRNPFAAPSATENDDDDDAVGTSSAADAASRRAPPDPFAGGASLAEGVLDEKAEHDEFVKAVDAWRNRDKPAVKPPSTTAHASASASASASAAAASAKPSSAASSAALAMAAKLAQDMESEQAAFALRVQREKEAAARRLEEARREDLKKVKIDVEFDCLAPEAKSSPAVSAAPRTGYDPRVGKLKIIAQPPRPKDAEVGALSPAACSVDDDGFDDAPAPAKTPRTMAVSLIESKLGSPGKKEQVELESAYLVDEGDDDD